MRERRKSLLIPLVLLLVLCGYATPAWAKDKLPKTRVRAWTLPYPIAQADSVSVAKDSSYLNFPMRDVLYDYSICNSTNGNLVSPTQSAIYFRRTHKTDCIFADAYDPYTITPQDVRFYNTTTPYSLISYKKGFTTYHEDNDLNFMFTGNITPQVNVGTTINYIDAIGHYKNQAGKTVNGSVFGSYNGNRYSLQAAFTFNTLSNFENGGLTNPEDIKNTDLNTEDMPVHLEGMTGFRYLSGYLNHYYSISVERQDTVRYKERDENGQWQQKDSVRTLYVPVTTFRHVFEVSEQTRRYVEKSRQNLYADCFRNPYTTRDSAATLTIRNTLSVTFEEEFNTVLKFGAIVYATNECQRHLFGIGQSEDLLQMPNTTGNNFYKLTAVPVNLMPDTLCAYRWDNNTFVGGELYKNRGKIIHYGFGGDVCVVGYKIGDFQVHGKMDANFRIAKDSMRLEAYASFKREKPDYYYSYYLSNHYRWKNDSLQAVYRFHVGGQVSYPTQWVTARLKVDYENITNHLYFQGIGHDTLFTGAGTPAQAKNVSVLSADLQLNITTPWVNLDNSVVYQYSSSYTLPLPTVALYSNLYYHGTWFKAMDAQIGVDLKFNTEYYAPYLNGATGQFCVQDKIKVGNYPVLSVYANFYVRLLHLRFFAQYQHFDATFAGKYYFNMPYYPANPDVFRAGLAFHFYN